MIPSLLQQFQCGEINSKSFMFAEITRRLFNLEQSTNEVETAHVAGVNTLNIEGIENRYLLSGSYSGDLCIHDLQNSTGQSPYTCKVVCKVSRNSRHAHDYSVDTVQWYPFDTGLFTTSSMDQKLKIWDSSTMKPADTFTLQGKIYAHHMSSIATHSLIATATSYPSVVLIDIKSGSQCHQLRGHKNHVVSVQWSPTAENLLATGGSDNKILLWDIRSAKGFLRALDQHNGEALSSRSDLITAHNGLVNSLCFSSDGLYMVSYGTDSYIRLWDIASSKNTLVNYGKLKHMNRKRIQIDVCYESAVPVVCVPSSYGIHMFEMFSGKKVNILIGHFNKVNCCEFRHNLQELYSGGHDHNILVWTADSHQDLTKDSDCRDALAQDNWSD